MDLSAFFGKKSKADPSPAAAAKTRKSPSLSPALFKKEKDVSEAKITKKKAAKVKEAKLWDADDSETSLSPQLPSFHTTPGAGRKNLKDRHDPEDMPMSESSAYLTASEHSNSFSDESYDFDLGKITTKGGEETLLDSYLACPLGPNRNGSLQNTKFSSMTSSTSDEDIEIVVNSLAAKNYVAAQARASNSSSNPSSARQLKLASSSRHSSPQVSARSIPAANAALENFDQLETLGYGSFGCVHRVRNKIDGIEYACKVLAKDKIVQKRQGKVIHLKNEKNILLSLNNAFIIQMHTAFVDERNIYLMLEYCDGGELFHLLRRAGRLTVRSARFYAAEIALALEYLHSFNIAFRDLKPENILLTRKGHVKLCDFGFAKIVDDRTWTLCGTPEYLAPEVIMGTGHDSAVDWWALGVLIFEMIAGYPPFYGDQPFDIYEKICDSAYRFPSNFEPLTRDVVSRFLSPQKQLRLGVAGGIASVKNHSFFAGIDWNLLGKQELEPPSTPVPLPPRPESYFREALPDFDQYNLRRPKSDYKSLHDELFKEFDMSFLG